MLEFPHTAVGALIGTKISRPLFSLPLAFLSHFLLDLIPHWNPSLYQEIQKYGQPTRKSTLLVILDSLASLTVGLFLASRLLPNLGRAITVILSCLLAVLPDVIEAPYLFLGYRHPFLRKIVQFERHWQTKAPFLPGLITQGLVAILAIKTAVG